MFHSYTPWKRQNTKGFQGRIYWNAKMAWIGLNQTRKEEDSTLPGYLLLKYIPISQNEICQKEIKIVKPRIQSSRNGSYWFTLAALEGKTFLPYEEVSHWHWFYSWDQSILCLLSRRVSLTSQEEHVNVALIDLFLCAIYLLRVSFTYSQPLRFFLIF